MKYLYPVLFILVCHWTYGQLPVAKVDINMEGRKMDEVNEDGYTSWFIARGVDASITVSGVTFELWATSPDNHATFRTSWSKALVQSPYYMRLVGDGVKIDADSLIAFPKTPAAFELRIKGLPKGKHLLQSFHNIWEDTTKYTYAPMDVYLNNTLLFSKVRRSVKVTNTLDATIVTTELNVTQDNQEMVLSFVADTTFSPTAGKTADWNVCINAFELNTSAAIKQACDPVPTHGDMHVDADSGYFNLQWGAAINNFTKIHTLYFAADSASVADATNTTQGICKGEFPVGNTTWKADGLSNLDTYYWRVDETDSSGFVTTGKIWRFKPRHMAFRDAEGYGRFATGGRGGIVVYVTNLNDAGPGSFRDAVTGNKGPRTVIFNVSGIITLDSKIFCDDYITLAGQTAPGKGICLRKSSLAISDESICRFMRMRLGSGESTDGMGMPGADHSIMDHCSVSWSIDEGCTSRNALNITVQKTLISEALNMANLHDDPNSRHGFAAVFGGDVATVHHNLLANNSGRNPRFDGGMDGNGYYKGRVDCFNNVVYNWNAHSAYGEAHEVQFVNNYYKQGPATNKTKIFNADVNQRESNKGTESYYTSGNVLELKDKSFMCNGSDPRCCIEYSLYGTMDFNWEIFVKEPFFPSYAKIESAYDASKSVLSDVGATMPIFDDHDKRMIYETQTGTYKYMGSKTGLPGVIDSETDAGGYEDYSGGTRAADFDTDLDGLPNWWEKLFGTNENSASGDFSDSNADPDKDGYTALEDYLEWMSVPHYFLNSYESDTIELSEFTAGYENPTFSIDASANFNLKISGSLLIISPISIRSGITYFDIKSVDKEGSTFTRRIGVCLGAANPDGVSKHKYLAQCRAYLAQDGTCLNVNIQSEKTTQISVTLYDLTGKVILEKVSPLYDGENHLAYIVPATLRRQMYLLKINDKPLGTNIYSSKILIK